METLDETRTPDLPFRRALTVSVIVLAALSLTIMPRSHWELDEFLFRAGIESFEPLKHHPHPPGYPALIAIGKVFTLVAGDPFEGMRALAIVSTLIGFVALASAVASLASSAVSGIGAAALFYFSCAQLVHSTTPMSDPPALAFLFTGLWAWSRIWPSGESRWSAALLGIALSLSIGCRPQYAVAIVPGLFVALLMRRSLRLTVITLSSFTLACLTWLVPLIAATGGVKGFVEYEAGQAAYVAAHDAELSRGWMSTGQIWERFVEQPWGGASMSTTILLLAVIGVVVVVRRRLWGLVPLAVISLIHLAFTLVSSDPADAVRYALVFQPLLAVLAAVSLTGIERWTGRRGVSLTVVVLFSVMSLVYAWPVVGLRSRGPSPPVRAASWIESNVPLDAMILYDNSMRPHAEALLAQREQLPFEDGVRALWNHPERSAWVLADGRTAVPGSRMFEWDGSEVAVDGGDLSMDVRRPWAKVFARLTRNHYGVVSVVPYDSRMRFLPGDGVFATERSPRRPEWRWLAPQARLTIPPGRGSLTVTLHVPRDFPEDFVDVRLSGDDVAPVEGRISRSETRAFELAFPEQGGDVVVRAGSSLVPRERGARDRRELAVQLLSITRAHSASDIIDVRNE